MSPDRLSAGQSADGLVHHRLKNGRRQILLCGPVVNQGLDIGFGEHAASGGNGIKGAVILRVLVKSRGVRLQKSGHLVDKRTRSARTDAVHTLFHVAAFKINNLGVLPAKLNGNVCFRRKLFQGGGHGYDLLYKRHFQVVGEGKPPGTGNHGVEP